MNQTMMTVTVGGWTAMAEQYRGIADGNGSISSSKHSCSRVICLIPSKNAISNVNCAVSAE